VPSNNFLSKLVRNACLPQKKLIAGHCTVWMASRSPTVLKNTRKNHVKEFDNVACNRLYCMRVLVWWESKYRNWILQQKNGDFMSQ
jgi:hypothetical protein